MGEASFALDLVVAFCDFRFASLPPRNYLCCISRAVWSVSQCIDRRHSGRHANQRRLRRCSASSTSPPSHLTRDCAGAGPHPSTAASEWPVRFAASRCRGTVADTRHMVLCGTLQAVEEWLANMPTALYVITDSSASSVRGRLNVHGWSGFRGQSGGLGAIMRICSRHVRGVARLIVDHAHRAPDAEAACDAHGSVTYAELCSMAYCIGEALASRVPACAADPESRAAGPEGDVFVGVQLAPSIQSCAALLGLNLRRLTPCDIADSPSKRQYMLQSLGCVALLAEGDLKPDLKGDLKGDLKADLKGDLKRLKRSRERHASCSSREQPSRWSGRRRDPSRRAPRACRCSAPRAWRATLSHGRAAQPCSATPHIVGWTSGAQASPRPWP